MRIQKFDNVYGSLELVRYPLEENPRLQPWDAADEYMLAAVKENIKLSVGFCFDWQPFHQLLIANDAFGALSLALDVMEPKSVFDSFLSMKAYEINWLNNTERQKNIWFPITHVPNQNYSRVLLKMPKSLALLEQWLMKIKPLLKENAILMTGVMQKYLQRSMVEMLEHYIGPTHTSLATKKAKFLLSKNQREIRESQEYDVIELSEYALSLINYKGIFSSKKLDIGTRFFLDAIPALLKKSKATRVLDLGCGNGALGIYYKQRYQEAHLTFSDESHLAIASTHANCQKYFSEEGFECRVSDGLSEFIEQKFDGILCNPPFHSQNAVNETMSFRLFKQARNALMKKGWICIIGNRHLTYGKMLKQLFTHVEVFKQNEKFVMYWCQC